jgi:hypothetical protein
VLVTDVVEEVAAGAVPGAVPQELADGYAVAEPGGLQVFGIEAAVAGAVALAVRSA